MRRFIITRRIRFEKTTYEYGGHVCSRGTDIPTGAG